MKKQKFHPHQSSEMVVCRFAVDLLGKCDDRGFEQLWSQCHELLARHGFGGRIKEVRARLSAARRAETARLLPQVHAFASRMLAAAKTGNTGAMAAARRELEGFRPRWAVVLYCNTKQTTYESLLQQAVSIWRNAHPVKTRQSPIRGRQLVGA